MWIRILWLWWTVCCLFLLALWAVTLAHSTVSLLAERQLATDLRVRELSHTLGYLHTLQSELLETLRLQAERGELTPERLGRARSQGQPLCHLYWGDAPAWMAALAEPRLRQQATVRLAPRPPGMEAGRLRPEELRLAPGTPDRYLLTAAHAGGRLLVVELDLPYLFQTWLAERARRFEMGGDLQAAWLEEGDNEAPPPLEPATWLSAWSQIGASRAWRWRIHDDSLGAIELRLDNTAAVAANLRLFLAVLASGGLLMATFAASIHLAGRGLRRELEYAEARSRFTAMVSHELRTPVTAIKMYAEILENGLVDDPAKIATYHQTLGREAERLQRQIEALLELGALEKGGRIFRPGALDWNELAGEAARSRGLSEEQLRLEPDLPAVRGDREACLQVLDNLIHNAQKYASDVLLLTRSDPAGAALEVRDRGPGVPPAERERIFEPYRRVAQQDHGTPPPVRFPLQGEPAGVGLGLALVKAFMQGQGGSVTLDDAPEGGARFTLRLPRWTA